MQLTDDERIKKAEEGAEKLGYKLFVRYVEQDAERDSFVLSAAELGSSLAQAGLSLGAVDTPPFSRADAFEEAIKALRAKLSSA